MVDRHLDPCSEAGHDAANSAMLGMWRYLRRLAVADLTVFHSYRSDVELMRYQGCDEMTIATAREFLEDNSRRSVFVAGEWCQLGIVSDGIGDVSTGGLPLGSELMGDVGIKLAEDACTITLGITLRREAQGRGLATRALTEVVEMAWSECPGVVAISASADLRNTPSLRLLERVGFA